MLKDITLGQYFPGTSFIHKLDARMKFILVIAYIIAIFAAENFFGYLFLYLSLFLIIILSKIKLPIVLKSMKPIVFILLFTATINMFLTSGETPLVSFWIIKIYPEGIYYALFMALRIICLVAGTFVLLTYTTSPVMLTDAIERLLSPLSKIGVPTHEFAMMMTIALRFIPTLIEETDKIMNAQKARGADFETGSLMKRAKALIPILIPLFVSAFRRADELAEAMECRLYTGGEGRTRMTVLKLSIRDFIALSFFIILFGIILFCNIKFGKVL